jgi:hypothetical protein
VDEYEVKTLLKTAADNEAKLRSGQYVRHEHYGVIPIGKARLLVESAGIDRAGREIARDHFRGVTENPADVDWAAAPEAPAPAPSSAAAAPAPSAADKVAALKAQLAEAIAAQG